VTFRNAFVLIGLLLLSNVYCQNKYIKIWGQVIDQENGAPVPYANVGLVNFSLGTSTNMEGYFELKVPLGGLTNQDSIKISSLGFKNEILPVSDDADQFLVIRLIGISYQIREVVILDVDPEKVLTEAFKRVKDNYSNKPYSANCFYRHYCKEDEKYGRLIEAAYDYYDAFGHEKLFRSPDEKLEFKVHQLRRSYDFTDNSYAHVPIAINESLRRDVISYNGVLSRFRGKKLKKPNKQFIYRFEGLTSYDGEPVYEISYTKERK